ncbi:uncharacterized protein LOC121987025 [Zingiber officinale]|uniref:uncharacterized protein LOC121987025 n=1 Tax=Zingiber officinale TaxID=94328 RepID=UPI001C4B6A46|nr:uncharacterized protein LOC121987025 [Zingiber officinale]
MRTIQMFVGLNLVLFALIVAVTQFMFDGSNRATILGWICVAFSISVYAAPLSIIRVVVRTRSVEFMPIGMSFCLTLSAAIWLGYGVFSHDIFVTIPTVIGFFFGVAQMVIYVIYKRMGCGPREAAAAAAEDGSGETSAARDSEFADAVEEDDAASETSSFIVPVASIPILTSEVLIFIKKKDRRARQGRSSRSATHVVEGSEPPRASSLDLEMPQQLEEEKDQRGKRVVEVEVGESSNTKEPTVTEHISKIAEHIAMISGHIVKLAEMNPTPNPDAPLDSSAAAAAAAEEKDGEEDQPVAMPSAVHEHVINMEKLTSVADTEAAAETKKSSKASKRVKA